MLEKIERLAAIIIALAAITGTVISYNQLCKMDDANRLQKENFYAQINVLETRTKNIGDKVRILSKQVNEPQPPKPTHGANVVMHSGREILHFSTPAAFRCGATLEWTDVEDWKPFEDKRICSDENVYRVIGSIVGYDGMKLSAEVYVPEIDNWFPSSGGGIVIPGNNGSFSADFCLRSKGPCRTFKFRLLKNDKAVGSECRIHINRK